MMQKTTGIEAVTLSSQHFEFLLCTIHVEILYPFRVKRAKAEENGRTYDKPEPFSEDGIFHRYLRFVGFGILGSSCFISLDATRPKSARFLYERNAATGLQRI
jgi:hypothetical protein